MSVQSTIEIDRQEAERMWIEKKLELYRAGYEVLALSCTNKQLEEELEEQFNNYRIVSKLAQAAERAMDE